MIRRTFQHIPGVGPWREKDLWARGIATWDDFPEEGGEVAISRQGDAVARERIERARQALAARELRSLAALIPPREQWRLYPEFEREVAFLDVETDGRDELRPTVVSVFDHSGLRAFIQGRNMEALPAALAESAIWVTFNGRCFDLPVLKSHFPELVEPAAHVDLRFLCRKVRLKGGLKEIEDGLGLGRPPHLRGTNGWDAVLLWRRYLATGDIEPLRFLVEYNLYDTFHLKTLLDVAYNRAIHQLAVDEPPRRVFERGDILYDVSRLLLDLDPTPRDVELHARVSGSKDRQLLDD
jgi:uncharacterized protein YprB with RNaseH-like and TPR domain